jgi:hypothetical protein
LKLLIENVNFSRLPIFGSAGGSDLEILPGWFFLTDIKNRGHRPISMNANVRAVLSNIIQDRATGLVFSYEPTGVSESTLRDGFETACKRAEIIYRLSTV